MAQKHRTNSVLFARSLGYLGRGAVFVFLLLGLLFVSFSFTQSKNRVEAATSSTLNFQARLMQSSGALVPDGNYHVEFKLYNASSSSGSSQGSCSGDSACVWTETRTTGNLVRVVNGYLTVNLGSVTSFGGTIDWDQEHWLTMNIGGSSGSASWDGEMTPRLKLTAVPYAFRAGQAASVQTNATNSASTNSSGVTIYSGNASGATSNSGSVTIDSGTATGTAGALLFGTTNASALTIGRSGITTTNGGALTVTGLTTLNGGLTVEAGDTFTFNGDAFTDLTGTGLTINTGSLQTTLGTSVDLASAEVTGTLAVTNGGTGAGTFTSNGIIYGNGTNALQVTAAGATGECLVGNTGSAPTWSSCGGGTVTLQDAYDDSSSPATITTADGKNLRVTLQDTTTDQTLEVSQAGAADAFRVNDDGTYTDATPFVIDQSGNVGIGDPTPTALLTVGASDAFQVNSSGAIAAATGITSSGTVTFSGLTADRLVSTTTGGQLTTSISSANAALSVSDETGSGLLVFGTTPTFSTSVVTDSTTFSVFNGTATTVNAFGASTSTTMGATSGTLNVRNTTMILGNSSSAVVFRSALNNVTSFTIQSADQSSGSVSSAAVIMGSGTVSGSTANSGAVTLQSGASSTSGNTGALTITSGNATSGNSGNVSIDVGTASGTAGTLNLGVTNASTINIGTGAQARTVSIGTGAAAQTVVLGSTNTTSTTTLQAGSGGVIVKPANSTSAFQVQNAAGEPSLLVNTTSSSSTLGLNNTSFESGTTGWSNRTGCTLTNVTAQYFFGYNSGKCANSATTNAGMNYLLTLSNSTQYTLSFYAKTTGTAGSVLSLGYSYNGSNETTYLSSGNYIGSSWARYSYTFTPTGITGSPYLFIKQSDATARDIFIDGVQIEATSAANLYAGAGTVQLPLIDRPLLISPSQNGTALEVLAQNGGNSKLLIADTNSFSVGVAVSTSPTANARLQIGNPNTFDYVSSALSVSGDTRTLVAQAGTSTTNLFVLQDSSGNALWDVSNTGVTTIKNSSSSGLQIQNGSGNQVLTVDTSGNQVVLGKASTLSGKLLFKGSNGSGDIGIQASSSAITAYTLTLPNAAGNTSECLKTDSGTATQLVFGSCGGSGTLQDGYNSSSSPATITTADGKNLRITLQDTTTDQTLEVSQAGTADAFRINDDGTYTDTTPFVVDADGKVGVNIATVDSTALMQIGGTVPASANGSALYLTPTLTSTSTQYGIRVAPTVTPSGASSANYTGVTSLISTSSPNMVNGSLTGMFAGVYHFGDDELTSAYGMIIQNYNDSSSILTKSTGLLVQGTENGGAGTNLHTIGINIVQVDASAYHTDLLIGTTTAPEDTYSIYNSSTSQNYFAGNVGIGDATPTALLTVGTSDAFQVNSSGAVIAVGVNSGAGLLQGTGGLTLTGTAQINATGSAATTIGNSGAVVTVAGSTINLNSATLATNQATVAVLNTTATTVDAFGAATDIDIGATTGTTNIQNPTVVVGASNTAMILRSSGANVTSFTVQSASQSAGSTSSAPLSLSSGSASGATSNSGTTTLQSGNSSTSGNTGTVTIKSGNATSGNSGNISIDAGTASGTTGTISVGTTSASAVTVGNSTAATTVTLQGGTGSSAMSIQAATGGTIGIGTSNNNNVSINTTAVAGTTTIGGTGTTGTITLGQSNSTNTIAIGSGTGATTVNISNGNTAGAVNIGAGFTTGTITIGGTGAQTGTISVGTGTGAQTLNFGTGSTGAKTVTVGSTAASSATTIQAAGGVTLLSSSANIVIGTSDTTGTLLVLDTKTSAGDPTGVNGAMYYNSDSKTFRCYEASVWADCLGLDPSRRIELYDEFISGTGGVDAATNQGNFGGLGWHLTSFSSGTCTVADIDVDWVANAALLSADRPGIARFGSEASHGASCTYSGYMAHLGNSTSDSIIMKGDTVIKAGIALETANTNNRMRVGLVDNQNAGNPTGGVWVEASTTAFWRYCYFNSGSPTCADSAEATVADTWASIEIRIKSVGSGTSAIDYIINGTKYSVTSTTLATANPVQNGILCWRTDNVGSSGRDCFVDYYYMRTLSAATR